MTQTTESLCAHNVVPDILAEIEQRIGPQRFNAWFKHGVKLTADDGRVDVAVPNPFVGSWIETHYQALIAESAQAADGRPHTVAVTVDPQLSGQVRQRQLDQQASQVEMEHSGRSRPRNEPSTSSSDSQ